MMPLRTRHGEALHRDTVVAPATQRGKLVIFLGASAGAGMTQALLEAGRIQQQLGRDVVVGIVKTWQPREVGVRSRELELLPPRVVAQRDVQTDELDLDGALERRPALLLVGELERANPPGFRHSQRWQDVEALLDAGIDVATTLSIEHIESLSGARAQLEQAEAMATVPDRVVDEAYDIQLVDSSTDELMLLRLEELDSPLLEVSKGTDPTLKAFFGRRRLLALRELALRTTAAQVHRQLRADERREGIERSWVVADRILVGVGPGSTSAHVIRAGQQLANGLGADWVAVHVETSGALLSSDASRERVGEHLRLAERLGAEVAHLNGDRPAPQLAEYARTHNITKIVIGKPTRAKSVKVLHPSILEELARATPNIDVHVIAGEKEAGRAYPHKAPGQREWAGFVVAVTTVGMCSMVGGLFGRQALPEVAMTYLLGIVLVAATFGPGPSMLSVVLSVLTFDYFFVPPYLSLAISDTRYAVTFAVMFSVAVVITRLANRIRDQAGAARQREARMARLYAMSRDLANTPSIDALLRIAVKHLHDLLDASVCGLLPATGGMLELASRGDGTFAPLSDDWLAIAWVWQHGKTAGLGTETFPSASARYLVMNGLRGRVGVLGIRVADDNRLADPEQRQLMDTLVAQIASALERAQLADSAQRARVQVETERLRSSLLSSVSHDLFTPLGVITGAASTLTDQQEHLSLPARQDLVDSIREEAERLNRLVRNLLDMTLLTSGTLPPKKEWHLVDEIVGVARNRLEERLIGRQVNVSLPADLPAIPLDAVLVEQVFINLLENALKYTPAGSPIDISATAKPGSVLIEVADRGPGIPEAEREAVFEKFYGRKQGGAQGGAGLGLAICRGVVEVHGGRIWVESRPGGGASFRFVLPIEKTPPELIETRVPASPDAPSGNH
jgi:two-component system sensor histidine kinase KdpD